MSIDLLQNLRQRGFRLTELPGGKLKVSPSERLTDADRDAIRNHKPALLALLANEYSPPWTDGEIKAFTGRVLFLIARGCTEPSAEAMAERLHQRDRDGTDLRLCWECTGHKRGVCTRWRVAGFLRPEAPLSEVFQRCPGFDLAADLANPS